MMKTSFGLPLLVTRSGFPLILEHHEEAVIQLFDAGCLTLSVCFEESATTRFQRQKSGKDDEGVLEHHCNALTAAHFFPLKVSSDDGRDDRQAPLGRLDKIRAPVDRAGGCFPDWQR
ncbi:hypothetical protein TKK_0001762 [Trichogramma kaykai]